MFDILAVYKDQVAVPEAIGSCTASARSKAHIMPMPEVDENTWIKYKNWLRRMLCLNLRKDKSKFKKE
jgi:hypothetical protein